MWNDRMKNKKPIKCIYFYTPTFRNKALVNYGFCKELKGTCILVDDKNKHCDLKREK